jgi:hypothetical protein
MDERWGAVTALALGLTAWGLILIAAGLGLGADRGPDRASPLGNGTPALFLGGGAAAAWVGLALLTWTARRARVARVWLFRVVQAGLFLALVVVVARMSGRVALVVAAALVVVASVIVRWFEVRMEREAVR